MSGSLEYSLDDYGAIQLFLDMMSAGWTVPKWLKDTDWTDLQLVTLRIANMEKLPDYSPDMPITITHSPDSTQHILEKTVTLNVGKSRSFSFTDDYGDYVQGHINNVTLIDMWKNTEEELSNPKLSEKFTSEQLEQARRQSYDALEQCCPKGMCYFCQIVSSNPQSPYYHRYQKAQKERPTTHSGEPLYAQNSLILSHSSILSPNSTQIPMASILNSRLCRY